jgi:hypothetical protein
MIQSKLYRVRIQGENTYIEGDTIKNALENAEKVFPLKTGRELKDTDVEEIQFFKDIWVCESDEVEA